MNKLFLRNVLPEDEKLILNWKNDLKCIQNSFTNMPVSPEIHHEWFTKVLQEETPLFYILTDGERNMGQIRVSLEADLGIISYSIANEFRGKGYAKIMLLCIINKMDGLTIPPKRLVAEVKKENKASAHLFRMMHFTEIEKTDRLIFERLLSQSQ